MSRVGSQGLDYLVFVLKVIVRVLNGDIRGKMRLGVLPEYFLEAVCGGAVVVIDITTKNIRTPLIETPA